METLEKRLAPAGLVTAALTGGALKLTGDSLDNDVAIHEINPDEFQIVGLNGTLIKLGTGPGVANLTVSAVTKSISVDLKDGNDVVLLQDHSFDGDISIQLGAGNNTAKLINLDLGGDLTIGALKGDDTVTAQDTSLSVAGLTKVSLGDGANTLDVNVNAPLLFGAGFAYTGGTGADTVTLNAPAITAGGLLSLNVGAGAANVDIDTETLRVFNSLSFSSLAHIGSNVSFDLDTASTFIGGSLTVLHGTGDNDTSLAATDSLEVGGDLAITNGATTLGSTTALAGGDLTVGGTFAITNGTGFFTTHVALDRLDVGKAITVTNGGTGTKASDIVTITDFTVSGELQATALNFTNAAGNFTTEIGLEQAFLSAGITVKNGNSTPVGSGLAAGETLTSIEGNLRLGTSLAITNGIGRFTNVIDDSAASGLSGGIRAGGGINIANGSTTATVSNQILVDHLSLTGGLIIKNGNSTGGIENTIAVRELYIGGLTAITNGNSTSSTLGIDTAITAGVRASVGAISIQNGSAAFDVDNTLTSPLLSVRGSLTIKSGTSQSIDHTISAADLSIGGGVTLSSTSGSTNNDILGESVRVGGPISLTHGAGRSDMDIGGANATSVFVNGNITAKFGGTTLSQIGNINLASLTIQGAVSIAAGTGTDSLRIDGDGRIAGGVTASFGAGDQAHLCLSGKQGDGTGLTVAGAVNLTASASTQRFFALQRGSFLGMNFTGGTGDDSVAIQGADIRTALKLDLLGNNDTVLIDDSNIRAGLTILTGAGADIVEIEKSGAFSGSSTFRGAVSINLGDDGDMLDVAPASAASGSAVFLAAVTLDGGNGTDTRHIGAAASFATPPVINNFEP